MMICVNPENGFLAVKNLSPDGNCQFMSLYTVQEMASLADQIRPSDTALILGSVAGVYTLVFVIKLILQQLGYRQ